MTSFADPIWQVLCPSQEGFMYCEWDDDALVQHAIPFHERRRCERMLRSPRRVSPAVHRSNRLVDVEPFHCSWCLWARVESGESDRLLRAFRPAPTLFIRDSRVRGTALWALSRSVSYEQCLRANERIARRLRTPRWTADPERLAFPVASVESGSWRVYRPVEVIGHLPDAFERNVAWRNAA
jgi:hypothetical protein